MPEPQCFVPALHNLKVHTTLFSQPRWLRGWSSANYRFPLRKLHWKGWVWASASIHTVLYTESTFGKVQMHTILQHWFLQCCHKYFNGVVLKFPPAQQVTMYICKAVVWPRWFSKSKVSREHFPGQAKLCIAIYFSSCDGERYHSLSASQPCSD